MASKEWWEEVVPMNFKTDKEFQTETDTLLDTIRDTSIPFFFE